jgi:hypothetical protein
MNIGYAMKIGFRSIRAGAASLDRITRAGGKVRLGKNGPTVVQSAAAGIIIGQLHKASKDKKADKKADKNAVNDMKADAAGAGDGRADRRRGGKKSNMALSMIRTGCNIRKAARNTERIYNLVQFSKKFR